MKLANIDDVMLALADGFAANRGAMDALRVDVSLMHREVEGLRGDVNAVQGAVEGLRGELATFREVVMHRLDRDRLQDSVTTDLAAMREDLAAMREDVTRAERP